MAGGGSEGPFGTNKGPFGRDLPFRVRSRIHAPGDEHSLSNGTVRRGMRRGWPQPQVAEDLLDDVGLINKGNDAHGAPAPLTHQRISLIDLLDQLGPALLEDR